MLTLIFVLLSVALFLIASRREWRPDPRVIIGLAVVWMVFLPELANAAVGSGIADTLGLWLGVVAKAVVIGIGERVWSWLSTKKATQTVEKYVNVHSLIQRLATEAVDYADEQAHKLTLKGNEKLAAAKEYATTFARKYGIPTASLSELEKVIEARLGAKRSGITSSAGLIA